MAPGYRSSGKPSGRKGFTTPSSPKQSRRSFLGTALALAAGAGLTAWGIHQFGDAPTRAPRAKPTPEQLADYFIHVVLPGEAAKNHKSLTLSPETKAALREAIIRYEQITLTADDALTYYGDTMNEDEKQYIRDRIAYHQSRNLEPGLAGIRALQDLQVNGQMQRNEINPMASPDFAYEIYMRNRRFNEAHGAMSDAQAQELSQAIREDWRSLQKRDTVIDFYTNTKDAMARGAMSYWSARDWTIKHAARELDAGTFEKSVEKGRRGPVPPAPPAPPSI